MYVYGRLRQEIFGDQLEVLAVGQIEESNRPENIFNYIEMSAHAHNSEGPLWKD